MRYTGALSGFAIAVGVIVRVGITEYSWGWAFFLAAGCAGLGSILGAIAPIRR